MIPSFSSRTTLVLGLLVGSTFFSEVLSYKDRDILRVILSPWLLRSQLPGHMILGVNRTSPLCLPGKGKFLKDQDRDLSPVEETLSVLESRAPTIYSMRGAPAAQRDLYPKTLADRWQESVGTVNIQRSPIRCVQGAGLLRAGWDVSWYPVLAVTAADQVRVG